MIEDIPANEAENEISRELDGDERLLWSGMPRQGMVLRGSDVFLIPANMLCCAFVMFWEAIALLMAITYNDPIAFLVPILGLLGVFITLYGLFGRFLLDSWIRARTFYAVTDRRIVIVSGCISRKIVSLDLSTLDDTALTEKPNCSGTITFGRPHPLGWLYDRTPWPGTKKFRVPSFVMIEDARSVYNILREAKAGDR